MTDRRPAGAVSRAARFLALAAMAALSVACGTTVPTASPLPAIPTVAPRSDAVPTDAATLVPVESEPPEPTDADTGSPGTPPCDIGAVKASHGLIDSDGDDRATEVVLVAADTCSIDADPELTLQGSNGKVLAHGDPAGAGAIDLVAGVAYTTEVRISNWCVDAAFPVQLQIVHDGAALSVTGESFPDQDNLPPCAHDDAAPVLRGTAWAPRA